MPDQLAKVGSEDIPPMNRDHLTMLVTSVLALVWLWQLWKLRQSNGW